jgi:hypothetical protein
MMAPIPLLAAVNYVYVAWFSEKPKSRAHLCKNLGDLPLLSSDVADLHEGLPSTSTIHLANSCVRPRTGIVFEFSRVAGLPAITSTAFHSARILPKQLGGQARALSLSRYSSATAIAFSECTSVVDQRQYLLALR